MEYEKQKKSEPARVCIVAQGGGMTAAYHAGVILALQQKYDLSNVHKVVATSGAAAIFSYFISDQPELMVPIYEDLITSKQFVSIHKHPLGRHLMNIDYMVDELIKKRYPLDLAALRASPIEFEVGVTEEATGKSVYFSKNNKTDFFEILRASCAVPYFGREAVTIHGARYLDGTISSITGIERAQDETHVLLLLTRPNHPIRNMFLVRHILAWLLMHNRPIPLRLMLDSYNRLGAQLRKFRQGKQVVVVRPKRDLPMHRVDIRLASLEATIRTGYLDTLSNRGLDKLFTPRH